MPIELVAIEWGGAIRMPVNGIVVSARTGQGVERFVGVFSNVRISLVCFGICTAQWSPMVLQLTVLTHFDEVPRFRRKVRARAHKDAENKHTGASSNDATDNYLHFVPAIYIVTSTPICSNRHL